jgi:hypothetical protein
LTPTKFTQTTRPDVNKALGEVCRAVDAAMQYAKQPGPAGSVGASGNLSARIDAFTPTNGQTLFTLSVAGSPNGLNVFVNGHAQRLTNDYTLTIVLGAVVGITWTNADFALTTTDFVQVAYFVLN